MIDIVRSFIKENALIEQNDKVLIAISGGIDSVVLFDVLLKLKDELGFFLSAAHYDHMIRPESADDAGFVKELCDRNSVEIYMSQGDVKKCAADEKIGLEAAARKMRHSFLRNVAAQSGANKIALAHHKNDRAETYLMRVLRGSGGDGLGCMPERDGIIVRPLMCAQRDEVEHYAKVNMLSWREDSSNSDTTYTRNNLRHNTILHLKENYNEAIISTLSNNARLMSLDRDYFNKEVDKVILKAEQTDDGYYLSDDSFIYLHKAILSRCIRKTIVMLGVDSDIYETNVSQVMELFYTQNTGASINLPQGIVARRDAFGVELLRNESAPHIFCETPFSPEGITYISDCGTFSCHDAQLNIKNVKNHSKNVAFFDTMCLTKDLTVRTRREGDVFHPLGAPGKKSLKKYFIDKKISRFKRDCIPLIAEGNEVLWIVGHEISEKVKVTDDSIMVKKIIFDKEKL